MHDHLHVGDDGPAEGRRPRTAASRSRPRRTWRYCFDVGEEDRLFWFTDIGWMMGPWLFNGALILGAHRRLFEGVPDHPGARPAVEPRRAAPHHVLGLSPTRVRALMPPRRRHGARATTSRRCACSAPPASRGTRSRGAGTSSTSAAAGCPIINYTGGTEISGGILGCSTITPLKPCAFAGPIPGIAADVIDEDGESVRGAGRRAGHPQAVAGHDRRASGAIRSATRRRTGRAGPDIWVHGDWAHVDDDGFWFIQGRSDDTIKIAGKRLGPAEVESAAVGHPAVAEAAAIGVPTQSRARASSVRRAPPGPRADRGAP